jgi:Domain of unknown function (DUF4326)
VNDDRADPASSLPRLAQATRRRASHSSTQQVRQPYLVGHEAQDAAEAVSMYRLYLMARPDLVAAARAELRGRTLACWCRPGDPCHADVLLEMANTPGFT